MVHIVCIVVDHILWFVDHILRSAVRTYCFSLFLVNTEHTSASLAFCVNKSCSILNGIDFFLHLYAS